MRARIGRWFLLSLDIDYVAAAMSARMPWNRITPAIMAISGFCMRLATRIVPPHRNDSGEPALQNGRNNDGSQCRPGEGAEPRRNARRGADTRHQPNTPGARRVGDECHTADSHNRWGHLTRRSVALPPLPPPFHRG